MSRFADTPRGRVGALLLRAWPALLVTAVGLAVLWPIPRGQMPLSADHTVHLTRAWMWAQELGSGGVVDREGLEQGVRHTLLGVDQVCVDLDPTQALRGGEQGVTPSLDPEGELRIALRLRGG